MNSFLSSTLRARVSQRKGRIWHTPRVCVPRVLFSTCKSSNCNAGGLHRTSFSKHLVNHPLRKLAGSRHSQELTRPPRVAVSSTRLANNFRSQTKRQFSTPVIHKHFILTYKYVPDVLKLRAPLRGAHLEHAKEYRLRNQLALGGATTALDRGVIIFKDIERETVEKYAKTDPYVCGDGSNPPVVTDFTIDQWDVVIGSYLEK